VVAPLSATREMGKGIHRGDRRAVDEGRNQNDRRAVNDRAAAGHGAAGDRGEVGEGSDLIAAAHRATGDALQLVQAWVADERFAGATLIIVTRRAISTRPDEDVLDLAAAPIWGLVRSAQSEHPDRGIVLVDTDDTEASRRALAGALDPTEPQLALRDG